MAIIESRLSSALSLDIGFDYSTFKCQNDLLNTEIRQERKDGQKQRKNWDYILIHNQKHTNATYPPHTATPAYQFITNLKNLYRILWIYKKEIQDGSGNPFGQEKEETTSQHSWMQTRGLSTQSPLRAADPEGVIKKRWCHSVKTRISCQYSLRKHPDRMWNVTTKNSKLDFSKEHHYYYIMKLFLNSEHWGTTKI